MASQKGKSAVEKQLTEAKTIEATLKTTKSDADASKLIYKLCEIFHDVILADCNAALRKDVPGRLWYSCFYRRITDIRTRIVKDKSRLKKRKASGGDVEDLKQRLKNNEEGLKKFIQEALTFYKYIVDELEGLLMPASTQTQMSQSQHSQSQSQSQLQSQYVGNSPSKSSVRHGLVPTIHKLYIHVGDLHRYDEKYSQAEKAYTKASMLAPGKGNPYNQLGVVAQLKESGSGSQPLPAVAFYWYCRSLTATNGAFETSDGNVKRLFQTNEKWLDTHGHSFEGDLKNVLVGPDKEEAKRIKSLASRIVLSRFVKLHGCFYKNAPNEELADNLTNQIGEILEVNPFGDALLIKMVAMSAFSVWRSLEEKATNINIGVQSYSLILRLGEQFCSYLKNILEKAKSKLEKGGKSYNIRLLGPLLLLCEFISDGQKRDIFGNIDSDVLRRDINKFWSGVASVATMISTSSHLSQYSEVEESCDSDDDEDLLPEDMKPLSRGCIPFVFLDEESNAQTEQQTYVSPECAMDALGLSITQTQSQLSQKSKKSVASQKSNIRAEFETRLKLSRFNAFILHHIEIGDLSKDDANVIKASHDAMVDDFASTNINETLISADFGQMSQGNFSPEQDKKSDDKSGDVLMYKESGYGKPALLVPSAFLLGEEAEMKDDGSDLLKLSAMIDVNSRPKREMAKTNSRGDLLNPSTILHQIARNDTMPPDAVMEESKGDAHVTASSNILPPMSPQVNPILENAPVRPPPGFQSSGPPPVLPPAPYSASPHPAPMLPMDSYAVLHNNQGNMQMPQASPFQSSMAPPGFQSNQMSSPVPQTRNPFAQPTYPNGLHQQSRFSQSFGMNGMAGANNHLSSGNTLLPSFLQPPPTSLEQNGNIDLDSDQHDRFGLRSLGIFSDESSYTKPLPETRNPFAFD